jgi:fumarate reductase subunit D
MKPPARKRSHAPAFWLLFGAGGMLSALVGPVLVFITGIAVPLGLLLPPHTLDHARVLALARHPAGQLALLAVIALFLFHGCHRLLHSLHDLGLRTGLATRILFYGAATAGSGLAAAVLRSIGG